MRKRLKSFSYAFSGLKTALIKEHNARIHLVAAVMALGCAAYFRISCYEWIAVVFAIGFVFAMELFNSAIENMADFVTQERHDTIRKVKDLSAAAVLASALAALVVGLIVFLPKICKLAW